MQPAIRVPAASIGRRPVLAGMAAASLAAAVPALAAADAIQVRRVQFPKGSSGTTLHGTILGRQTIDYIVGARAGQMLTVVLQAKNASVNFNVLPPGSEEATFIGSTSGTRFEGRLQATGDQRIRVYLMASAARRAEKAAYTLSMTISG